MTEKIGQESDFVLLYSQGHNILITFWVFIALNIGKYFRLHEMGLIEDGDLGLIYTPVPEQYVTPFLSQDHEWIQVLAYMMNKVFCRIQGSFNFLLAE